MSPRTARALRRLLNLPRIPREMDAVERQTYRNLKARFNRLPAPARRSFLTNLALLRETMSVTAS